jgi:hypothetical protein
LFFFTLKYAVLSTYCKFQYGGHRPACIMI